MEQQNEQPKKMMKKMVKATEGDGTVKHFTAINQAGKHYGFNPAHIYYICAGKCYWNPKAVDGIDFEYYEGNKDDVKFIFYSKLQYNGIQRGISDSITVGKAIDIKQLNNVVDLKKTIGTYYVVNNGSQNIEQMGPACWLLRELLKDNGLIRTTVVSGINSILSLSHIAVQGKKELLQSVHNRLMQFVNNKDEIQKGIRHRFLK